MRPDVDWRPVANYDLPCADDNGNPSGLHSEGRGGRKILLHKRTKARTVLALTSAIFLCGLPLIAMAEEKETVGAVEEAILLPWNIKILARVDTGAAASSLDARDIAVKGKFVEFKLRDSAGGRPLRLPLVRWRKVRTSDGEARRPVVRLELCLGSQVVTTEVNLNDRSAMEYPFLIGRRLLSGRFVVDVSRQRMIPPKCPKGLSH